ncbi:DUF5011 domain-containing protein [Pontibacillus sp. ALD_SL1]|uniref:immunoglobulin-like domain-containing protein n=1 Tax=Pontibacillus sp. ALD_SL1 TaxID=2777185 RepID=UPI001A95F5D9|nr:immunoglobulin-like domain-containing protein [Pontibacillus sp. ALD_SL1]QSS99800.1 DUF5011 domain-containing protein [Pontibacillus sp. ALD_SL1]
MKKSQLKVMTSAALAAAVAVPVAVPVAAAVPATTVDAAEVTVEYVAIEVDGTVEVVTYDNLARQMVKGSGDVYDLLQEGTIVSVGVNKDTFVSYEALAKAVVTTEDKDTFEILAELMLDESKLVDSSDYPIPGVPKEDTEAPEFLYKGTATIQVENGSEFTVPEISALDNVDEDVEVNTEITKDGETVESIDTTVAGEYTVTYTAADEAGNQAEPLVITVEVAEAPDTEAPVLTLDGESTISLENGEELTLPTVTVTDNVDEEVEVTSVITDSEGNAVEEIDTTVAGTYTVTYTATDAAGNVSAEEVVTVEVAEAITVDSVSALDATTLEVTWSNGETTEVTLEEALLDGATTVTFSYDGEEYTDVELSEAYVAPDTEAPVVTVDGLTTDSTVFGSSLTFSVDATDNMDEEVTPVVMFGDEEVEMNEDGTYTVELTEGENTISVKAMDEAGNETEVQDFTVSYDASVTNATEAVVAFEDTSIETFADVATATEAQTSAEEAIALVADEEVQAELQSRVDAQVTANEEVLSTVVEDVTSASNQVQLNTALQGFFTNVDADLIADYSTAIDGSEETVEEIQMDVYTVNAVNDVEDADTQVELLAALQAGEETGVFSNVREEYIETYDANIVGADLTAEDIQEAIDGAVNDVVDTAVTAVEEAEADPASDVELQEAREAIATVPSDLVDEEGNNILEGLQERLESVAVVNDVLAADTVSQVRLLASLNDNGFENVNADLIAQYDTEIDGSVTVEEIQTVVNRVNAVDSVETSLNALTTTNDEDATVLVEGVTQGDIDSVQEQIENLESEYSLEVASYESELNEAQELLNIEEAAATIDSLTSTNDEDETILAEGVTQEDIDAAQELLDSTSYDSEADAAGYQADLEAAQDLLDALNLEEATTAIDALTTTNDSDETVLAEGVTQADIDEAQELLDASAYDTETDSEEYQAAIAEAQDLLNAINLEEATTAIDALTTTNDSDETVLAEGVAQTEIDAAQALLDASAYDTSADSEGYQDDIELAQNLFDTAQINAATTVSDLEPLLVNLDLDAYNNLTSTQRLEVAEWFLAGDDEFDSTAEVKAALTLDVSEYEAGIATVNDLSVNTISGMDEVLDELNIEEYESLLLHSNLLLLRMFLTTEQMQMKMV